MITTLPAVQLDVKKVSRYTPYGTNKKRNDKRIANRRYRRYLNALTHRFTFDATLFDNEPFNAPSLSGWDLW